MIIELYYTDKAAIRKGDCFGDFSALLQHAFGYSENKLSETFKNPLLSHPSPLSSAQIRSFFFPRRAPFPGLKVEGAQAKPYLLTLLKPNMVIR